MKQKKPRPEPSIGGPIITTYWWELPLAIVVFGGFVLWMILVILGLI